MITYLLVFPIYLFAAALASLLPVASLPSGVTDAVSGVATYASQLDGMFPVATIASVLVLTVSFEGGVLVFRGIRWIIKTVRGSG